MNTVKILIVFSFLFFFACGSDVSGDYEVASGSSSASSGEGDGDGDEERPSDPKILTLCGGLEKKPTECCNGIMAGEGFDTDKTFCGTEYSEGDSKIYPKCGGEKYHPLNEGCYDSKIYAKCSAEDTRGVCVHNVNNINIANTGVLRCRQLKGAQSMSVSSYIIDPLPGMKCNENGTITGINEGTIAVQIGRQIWTASDIEINGAKSFDWATALDLPSSCNYTKDDCPPSRPAGTLLGAKCPAGYSIPRNEDWKILVDYAGGNIIAGDRLKSTTGWDDNGKGVNGTDSYGFNAKPHFPYGSYYQGNKVAGAFWWVEDAQYTSADYWNIISADSEIRNHFRDKVNDGAMRCMRYSAPM